MNIKISQIGIDGMFEVSNYHKQSDTWIAASYNGKNIFTEVEAEEFAIKLIEIHKLRNVQNVKYISIDIKKPGHKSGLFFE